MNYKQALEYINGVSWLGSRPGLERIGELLDRLGNPERELRFVHVAGTNGKGSVCALLASVLKKAGLKTGLYTSPYLFSFNERMQINGKRIPDAKVAELVSEIKTHAELMDEHPTEFEMMTAAALLWFSREKCDIAVLEVGLGGRLDATNIIPCPECAVIANIGLDHTAILGDTVAEIAAEKAGIIKEGCSVVLYQQSFEVMEVVRDICAERGASLTVPDFSDIVSEFDSLDGQVFSYRGESYAIPLLGAHQRRNTAVAVEVLSILRERGWSIDDTAIEAGLYSVSWPARFELVHSEPWFVVDGGHNPQCAEALREGIEHYFPEDRRVLLIGMLRDKDYSSVIGTLAPLFDEFITVTPSSPRALSSAELAEQLKVFGRPVSVCESVKEGVSAALDAAGRLDGMVCAAGSLYICGEIRAFFGLK